MFQCSITYQAALPEHFVAPGDIQAGMTLVRVSHMVRNFSMKEPILQGFNTPPPLSLVFVRAVCHVTLYLDLSLTLTHNPDP